MTRRRANVPGRDPNLKGDSNESAHQQAYDEHDEHDPRHDAAFPDRSEVWEWLRDDLIEMATEAGQFVVDSNKIQMLLGRAIVVMRQLEDEERGYYAPDDDELAVNGSAVAS